jgi:hypothetical protein
LTAALPRQLLTIGRERIADFEQKVGSIPAWSIGNALFLGGVGAMSYGFWLCWHPLGFIVGGWSCIRVAFMIGAQTR